MGVPATNQTLNVLKCNTYCFCKKEENALMQGLNSGK